MTRVWNLIKSLVATAMIVCTVAAPVHAAGMFGNFSTKRTVNISSDRGGYVVKYMLKMREHERKGTKLRFTGRCDSACTLYLALPKSQTCISPGARFGFHRPFGASADGNRLVQNVMERTYPAWVRSWIAKSGGLTKDIKVMPYSYAKRYLPTCTSMNA